MRNGKILKGRILTQNTKILKIKKEDGTTETVPKTLVLKVVYKDINEQEAQKIKKEEEAKLAKQKLIDDEKLKIDQELAEKQKKEEEARLEKEKKEEEERLKKEQELAEKNQKAEKKRLEKEQKRKSSGEKQIYTKAGVFWRSAILPGWGQVVDGRNEGYVEGGAFLLSGLAFYNKNRELQNATRDLGDMQNPYKTYMPTPNLTNLSAAYMYNLPFEKQQAAVDRHFREARNFGVLAILFYSYNLFDAWYFYQGGKSAAVAPLTKSQSLARSAIFPGLGQMQSGRKIAGYSYGSVFVISLVTWASKYHEMLEARKFQARMFNPYETFVPVPNLSNPVDAWFYEQSFASQRRIVNTYYNESKFFAAVAVLTYLLSLGDAYFLHKMPGSAQIIIDAGNSVYSLNNQNISDSYLKIGYNSRF